MVPHETVLSRHARARSPQAPADPLRQEDSQAMKIRRTAVAAAVALVAACATIREFIQPPRFEVAEGRQAELRLLGPSRERPLGGAGIRLWSRVENPNPFGLTIRTLTGDLFLEGTRAAEVNLPLGLPLQASQDTVVPIDLLISFSDLPGLTDVAARLLTRRTVAYRLDGTVGVDAGPFGTPAFGPMTLLQGEMVVRR